MFKQIKNSGWPRGSRRSQPQRNPAPSVLAAYRRWQQQFFYQRLGLLMKAFLLLLVSITLFEVGLSFWKPEEVSTATFIVDALIGGTLLIGLALRKTRWGKQYAGTLFLGMSAAVILTLFGQSLALQNFDENDVLLWTLMFLSQAALLPVRWKLHLRSQLILFIPLSTLLLIAGITSEPGDERQELILGTIATYIYLLWVCCIADLAVYLYERLRYEEFEAQQTIQTFLHAVSHDLRNPVTGMQLLLKSLLEQPGHTEADTVAVSRAVIEQMLRSGDQQLCLINSLLEAHNTQFKSIALQCQPLALQPLVNNIHQELKPLLLTSHATVLNQIAPELPLVYGDSTQLWRVFSNLIANAIQHNPPEITVQIEATVKQSPASHVYCTVSDDGVGMTAEHLEHLFDLYTQGVHRRRHLSIGLGLYIAKHIVEAHGGKIGAHSKPDQGTCFWLTLPVY
ncbi:MAG: HAMP domain-containing sensor histidine kinase [Cyanobacteria bacterium P01_A01_bin.114]